jgi:sucrose phosphorylase
MQQTLPKGVMFNAYPDSIGAKLSDVVSMLQRPEFRDTFSLFYILPTFFHSDLDRGFSIIDYDINEELVSTDDLDALNKLGIQIKFDLVLNHLSVRSPQFIDLMMKGDKSEYVDFFIDWDEFWQNNGSVSNDGHIVPDKDCMAKLFMRKPELPILKLRFPDGQVKTYWNTFYQKVEFDEISVHDIESIEGIDTERAKELRDQICVVIEEQGILDVEDLDNFSNHDEALKQALINAICSKRQFLGQMDLNAQSEGVWEFYDKTLKKLSDYGAKVIRLDAFAYLHKQPCQPNFFNRPGTWVYLNRLRAIAEKYDLIVFPEIHSEYGAGIHEEVAGEGYPIYDFYLPGLIIDALERGDSRALSRWIKEIRDNNLQTINMLGCHDGIPILDLRGKTLDGQYRPGLLDDDLIEEMIQIVIDRGGMTKNLYDADGNKIDYYQVNATYFSALGEDEQKLRLARAIQMFMPGLPEVWYLDLFAGANDYAAVEHAGPAGHKEINRTTLSIDDIDAGLKKPVVIDQLELIRLRNTSPAFSGDLELIGSDPERLQLCWRKENKGLLLDADLKDHSFTIDEIDSNDNRKTLMRFSRAG